MVYTIQLMRLIGLKTITVRFPYINSLPKRIINEFHDVFKFLKMCIIPIFKL